MKKYHWVVLQFILVLFFIPAVYAQFIPDSSLRMYHPSADTDDEIRQMFDFNFEYMHAGIQAWYIQNFYATTHISCEPIEHATSGQQTKSFLKFTIAHRGIDGVGIGGYVLDYNVKGLPQVLIANIYVPVDEKSAPYWREKPFKKLNKKKYNLSINEKQLATEEIPLVWYGRWPLSIFKQVYRNTLHFSQAHAVTINRCLETIDSTNLN
ncbi:MAG: hypothetical protein KDK51_04965 [Deltaproteobacteria bacterium]|nr:hypothetical protein [Deltaproteobacteria bacterium]